MVFTTTVIWGVIGPSRIFSSPESYSRPLLYYFLLSAILPNYVTSAALDTSQILCTLLVFFTLDLTNARPPQERISSWSLLPRGESGSIRYLKLGAPNLQSRKGILEYMLSSMFHHVGVGSPVVATAAFDFKNLNLLNSNLTNQCRTRGSGLALEMLDADLPFSGVACERLGTASPMLMYNIHNHETRIRIDIPDKLQLTVEICMPCEH
ncbi:hypothetical protein DSL72_009373 [Monilinia vaccinii-corymbosi]|uniref:Uncharacterized protein n=1 Tax=Monilinia vaccinii-corymbosi TaxID=61207 RepID=A0A8A3PQX8_9HELO|nr:hypothetical protein DSL72_009373 [Monilinia vaccinii-corymbosi]